MHNLFRIKFKICEPLEANSVYRHNDVLMNSESDYRTNMLMQHSHSFQNHFILLLFLSCDLLFAAVSLSKDKLCLKLILYVLTRLMFVRIPNNVLELVYTHG